ncbi:MAG: VWA domain-containing protein [Candidatus Moranbacteria bacterium]|nr:VWA domain-containing protein [Candidatus Moranbacteria bacterium]
MALALDLKKAEQTLVLDLQKAGITNIPSVDVAFDLDVSGSFDDEHKAGLTNDIVSRLIPWGLVFDPDKKIDMFTFSNGARNAYYVGEINEKNYLNYVWDNIIDKVPGYNGGTDYHYVLRKNLQHFGWLAPDVAAVQPKSGGFFGKMFGGHAQPAAASVNTSVKRKSLVLFGTDGDNSDKAETRQLLQEMEQRGDEMYVQFFAFSNQGGQFRFLQEIADEFSNTGLHICRNIPAFLKMSDEEINQILIQQELIDWLKK